MGEPAGSLDHGPGRKRACLSGVRPCEQMGGGGLNSRGRAGPGAVYHPRRAGVRQEEGHGMRAARGAGLVLALVLGACRSRSGDAADAGLVVEPAALHCETLLPQDVRELVLPGFTFQEERACPTCGPQCAFRSAAEPEVRVSLTYDCQAHYARAELDTLLAPALKAGGTEVAGMGRAAARRAPVPGMLQVVAWDDDTPCALVVTWLGGDTERALVVASTALRAATPGSLAGTPAVLVDTRPPAPAPETLPVDATGLLPSAPDAGLTVPPGDAGAPL